MCGPWAFAVLVVVGSVGLPGLARADKVPHDDALKPAGEKEALGEHPVGSDAVTYRPGKGLSVTSDDGDFALVTRLRLQTLLTAEKEPEADAELGLMLRRARLQFVGNVFGKHNKFKTEFAFSPRDLSTKQVGSDTFLRQSPLLTWFVELDHVRDLTIRFGQYKIPFSRQRVISSGDLQMVDRSIANGEFTLDRDIGIDIRSKDLFGLGMLRYYLGIYNGEGRSAFTNGNFDLMYLGRVELLPLGMFKDYAEADFERLATPGVSIGISYAFSPKSGRSRVNQSSAPKDGGTTDFHNLALDITFKYLGLSLSAEFFLRGGTRQQGDAVDEMGARIPTEAARKGYGWFAQAGYLLPQLPIEVAARFGQVEARGSSSLSDGNELGLAASYYVAGHPFKIQADAFRLWESDFSMGDTRARLQAQVAF